MSLTDFSFIKNAAQSLADKLIGNKTPQVFHPDIPKQQPPANLSAFNPELIITDWQMTNVNSMNEIQIQDFLKSKESFLADYKIDDKLISYWISKHTSDNGLNPQVLITNIQKEQGSITRKVAPAKQRTLDYMCGVGSYDKTGDDPKWKGADKQILGATLVNIKWYKKSLALKFPYSYVTDIGEKRSLKIQNAATMSLYMYTPYVGDKTTVIYKNKYDAPFANLLFWKIYSKWFG
jgi:hypothetical protein